MKLKHFVALLAIFLTINSVFAACSDPLGYEVSWTGCDKSMVDIISNTNISYGKFNDAKLGNANLSHISTFYGWAFEAKFNNATMHQVKLVSKQYGSDRSTWDKADFTNADLSGYDDTHRTVLDGPFTNAKFNGTDLSWTDIDAAAFPGADFTGAKINTTTKMTKANFYGATWIDGTTKCGPLSIGKCNTDYNKPLKVSIYRDTLDFPGSHIVLSGAVLKNEKMTDWISDVGGSHYTGYINKTLEGFSVGISKTHEESYLEQCKFNLDSSFSEVIINLEVQDTGGKWRCDMRGTGYGMWTIPVHAVCKLQAKRERDGLQYSEKTFGKKVYYRNAIIPCLP
jgi:hypothetical protein